MDMIKGKILKIEVITTDNYFSYSEGGALDVKLEIVEERDAVSIIQTYEAHDIKKQIVHMYDYATFNKSDIKRIRCYIKG